MPSRESEKSTPVTGIAINSETLKELEELRIDARLGKDKHFSAAERTKNLNVIFGLPVVVINLLLGSVFFTELISVEIRDTAGPIFAFLAATIGAIHTFFNFHKSMEGHRSIGNRYIGVSRRCRTLMRGYRDGHVSKKGLWEQLNELSEIYHSINAEAESFPTTRRDFERAVRKKQDREKRVDGTAAESVSPHGSSPDSTRAPSSEEQ